MEITLRPTDKVVELRGDDGVVPARIWQGQTSSGIPVHCYVTRIAIDKDRPQHELEEFERTLQETEAPRPDVAAIDMRLIL